MYHCDIWLITGEEYQICSHTRWS